jgi:hypothetical protein
VRIHAEPDRPDFHDRTKTTDDLRLVKNLDGEQWIWVIAVLAGAALVLLLWSWAIPGAQNPQAIRQTPRTPRRKRAAD